VTAFLIDANVVSELVRPSPDQRVMRFLSIERDLWLSVVTLHELTYGAERVKDMLRRHRLTTWIEALKLRFKERLIVTDAAIAEQAGRARANAATQGLTVDPLDALIAATAQLRLMTLVTRNVRDFAAFDVRTYNPWTD
jgi:hypothetical protein